MIDKLSKPSGDSGHPIFTTPLKTRDESQLARLSTHWTKSAVAIVSAHGEIDAANAHAFTEYILADLAHCRALILDMADLEFFGAAGFSVLERISVGCADAGIDWALVPGTAVSRLLRICDPADSLPIVYTVGAAHAFLQHHLPMQTTGDRAGASA